MENEKECLFDVCNDYSLEVADGKWNKFDYSASLGNIKGKQVLVYTNMEYNEIHYVYGPKKLEGAFLF